MKKKKKSILSGFVSEVAAISLCLCCCISKCAIIFVLIVSQRRER